MLRLLIFLIGISVASIAAAQEQSPIWSIDWWVKVATVSNGFFALVLAISTIGLWIVTKKSADAASQSAGVASAQLRIARRPWVGLYGPAEIVEPLTFAQHGATLKVRFRAKNGGSTPAKGTAIFSGLKIVPHPHADPRALASQVSKEEVLQFKDFGTLRLPGEEWDFGVSDLYAPANTFMAGPEGKVVVFVSGHITYRDEFEEPHATTFLCRYHSCPKQVVTLGHSKV